MPIIDQIPAPLKDAAEFLGLVKDKCKIGTDLELTLEVVSKHKITRDYDVPDKRTEAGYNIADNIDDKPMGFTLQAISNEWDWRDKKRMLVQMAEAKKPIQFYSLVDKIVYENLAIKNLTFEASYRQANGFTASFTLKQIRVEEAEKSEFGVDISQDKKGQTAQGNANSLGDVDEVNPAKDGLFGKAFGPDGILKEFNAEGGLSGFLGGF
jgi:hypothetical protein